MDAGHHIKVQTPGHDAVHVCRKCGWPFPNAHPSARHRRAHKKVCGTLEGHKLAVSNGSDDEDYKTPSPLVVERGVNEKGSSAIGERSNKSEDEVFTDAAAEFSDSSGFSPGVEQLLVDSKKSPSSVERVAMDDSASNQSVKDSTITDILQPSSSSINHFPVKNPEVPDSTTDQDNVPTTGSAVISVPSHVEESHNVITNDSNSASYLIKSEKPADDAAHESLSKVIGQDSDSRENQEIKLDGVSQDIIIKHCSNEITDIAPELEEMNEPADEVLLLSKEESTEDLNPKISVPADLHVLAHPEIVLEYSEDHKGVKLDQLVPLDSCERIEDNEDSLKKRVCEDNSSSFQSKQWAEGSVVTSSVMPVLEEKLDDGSCKFAVKEVPSEGEVSLPEPTITVDKNNQSDEVRVHDLSNDSLCMSFPDVATEVLSDVNFIDSSTEVKVNEPTNSADVAEAGDHEKDTNENYDIVRTENSGGVAEDSIENIGNAHESSSSSSGFQINSTISEDNNAGSEEHLKSEKCDIYEDGSSGGPVEENVSMNTKSVPEFSSNLHESLVADMDATYGSNDKVPDNGYTHLGTVSELSRAGTEVSNIQEDTEEKINSSNTVQMECVGRINMPTESSHVKDIEIAQKVSEPYIMQEPLVSKISAAAVEEENDLGGGVTETSQAEADNNNYKQNISGADRSIDSCSPTDSLDAHWGSVSVISMQSDVHTVIDAESDSKVELEGQSADKSDPPSPLTLVENGKKVNGTKIKADQNAQQSMQEGYSILGSGKRHIPLKSLIGESKPKSSDPKENAAQGGSPTRDNGAKTTTVNSILGSESPAAQATMEQDAEEWSMAARYPSEIKGGKRKVKGRPIWAQFVCCSSVN